MRRTAHHLVWLCLAALLDTGATQAAPIQVADATGATHCSLRGFLTDKDPKGSNVRAAPRAGAPVIGRLPPRGELEPGHPGEIVGPEFEITGSKDGWLLIRGATGTAAGDDKIYFHGPGWIAGGLVGFTIGSNELRTAPADDARVITKLLGQGKDGSGYGPDSFQVTRVLGCQQHFAEVALKAPRGFGLSNAMQGWVGRVCGNQLTTCDPAFAQVTAAEDEARGSCLEGIGAAPDDTSCKVSGYGPIGKLDGHDFLYAIYQYGNKDGVVLDTRAVIFERRADNYLYVLFSPDSDGGRYDTPKLVKSPAGTVLHIPGYESGTGNFNREQLYLWRDGAWREVDSVSWLADLQRRLPKGLSARKGIYPDYTTMKAATPLWREADGNAEATGGHADITLRWVGERIALAGLKLRKSRKDDD